MGTNQTQKKLKSLGLSTRALHVFVLFSLAFAARLYTTLGRQPMFFVARQSEAVDVLTFVLILSVLLPGLLVLLQWLAGLASGRIGLGCHTVVVLLATAAVAMGALKPIERLPNSSSAWLAVSLGALGTAAYCRFAAARSVVTIFWPAALLFPGIFLFGSPVFALVLGVGKPSAWDVRIGRPAPVVMVVFDEFCGTSLLDQDRRIDANRYPNFAALAEDATWFRNATTMSPSTHQALPSLLTGGYPQSLRHPPLVSEFPRNLFTLLSNSHEVIAWETETYLCPTHLSRRDSGGAGLLRRLRSLLIDAAVVELYILLPRDWPFVLPDVTGRWGNFLDQDRNFGGRPNPHVRRGELFRDFLRRIGPSEKPGLYFAHLMLPHVPWTYVGSGKEYPLPRILQRPDNPNFTHGAVGLKRSSERWVDDELAVDQAHQRYLLQLRFVDRLIGELVDRLKQVGLYDRSLIVITADHGVSFRPGDERRALTDTNYPDIMSIPLLFKLPHQHEGRISDRNVQSADVLPTIAGALKIELPWTPDGADALEASSPEPVMKQIAPEEESEGRRAFDGALEEKYDTLSRMLAAFGSGQESLGLFRIGPHNKLLGHPIEELLIDQSLSVRIELADPGRFDDVDLDGQNVPCYVAGRVVPRPRTALPLDLAVAVNGTIWAVTRTFLIDGFETTWAAMVPEEAFRSGRNEVRVFVVSSAGEEVTLGPTTLASAGAEK